MTTKNECHPTRKVRRINLSLPVVQTDSYEIYYSVPTSHSRQASHLRPISRQKPPSADSVVTPNHPIESKNPIINAEPRDRLKHLPGPVLINVFVDTPSRQPQTSSKAADTISNALINSGYSGQTLRTLPAIVKHHNHLHHKDDADHSQASSNDKLLQESTSSFEDIFQRKPKASLWHNIHHPQLTTSKILHRRNRSKRLFGLSDVYLRAPNTSSLGTLSQVSAVSSDEQLYAKIEHLTKNYFPTIQQLRHGHPCPELINNRLHLHREEKRDFLPPIFRSRVDR